MARKEVTNVLELRTSLSEAQRAKGHMRHTDNKFLAITPGTGTDRVSTPPSYPLPGKWLLGGGILSLLRSSRAVEIPHHCKDTRF